MILRAFLLMWFSAMSTTALSQQWVQTESDGLIVAEIEEGASRLTVRCSPNIEIGQNAIRVDLNGTPVTGQTQFQFNDGSQQAVLLENGMMGADTDNNAALFSGVISRLKQASDVTVRLPDGAEQTFSLRGSTRAIGECPLPSIPFDMADCEDERGFGYIRYGLGTGPFALSDFCINRDEGSLRGLESFGGLTLTKDDGVNFTYENLSSGGAIRPTLQIAPVITSTYHGGIIDDQSPEFNFNNGDLSIVGYLYNALGSPERMGESFGVLVALGEPLFGLYGEATFENGHATFELIDSPMFGLSRNGQGQLAFVVADDGSVSGSGAFEAENVRVAGYSPNEWVKAEFEVSELRGFIVGETGQVIKTHALITGEVIDAEGDVRSVETLAEIFLLDLAILP